MDALPLPSLLSQALVAFTIEFDNEAERRLPHRTTSHGGSPPGGLPRPWLVSMVMWLNCLCHVEDDGVTVRELERRARTPTNLAGMQRWGYVVVHPAASQSKGRTPKWSWIVRLTPAGRNAKQVLQPLFAELEGRWEQRFGASCMARLRSALEIMGSLLDPALPDCMPILGYGMDNASRLTKLTPAHEPSPSRGFLAGLLARVLLAFALAFEHDSEVSLAISANLLRILDRDGLRVRDLPPRSGVSKESLQMALGVLVKRKIVLLESPRSKGHFVTAHLTPLGEAAKERCAGRLETVEEQWLQRYGGDTIGLLRTSLEALVGDATPEGSPLFRGLAPHPDGWRAKVRRPETLPHFPMVLHRGGFPDGS